MYLKSLELNGFKSFADHTHLDFAPGITAIVGPNGCGKSNIFDSVCWVLGEQSTKMLRGTKQEDFIFNGTDIRKPMGMAEVSLTFSDCEKVLGTEYHEITVTRRVFRSGEGQYFINKTPCRLKDIQRLFMDTGIGTSSYSLMGQGRIDLILTSRAEDRREIFEEASGITKYKADRKEALRKLEQTEQNLLRLADIMREVKRQIISLQRQAGKARRYKELHDGLRKMDVFAARNKLGALASEVADFERRAQEHAEALAGLEKEIGAAEEEVRGVRSRARESESFEADAREKDLQLRERLAGLQQQAKAGEARIAELDALLKENEQDIGAAAAGLKEDKAALERSRAFLESAQAGLEESRRNLAAKTARLQEQDKAIERVRAAVRDLGSESMSLEGRLAKLANDLKGIEDSERSSAFRREKLEAEKSHQQRIFASYEERSRQMAGLIKKLEADVAAAEELARAAAGREHSLAEQAHKQEQARSELLSEIAANRAQVRMLEKSLAEKDEYPEGIRKLLDASNPLGAEAGEVIGPLADLLETPPKFRLALEAALRAWLDAVVISDRPRAIELLMRLRSLNAGEARLLCADAGPGEPPALLPDAGFPRLSTMVKCPTAVRPLADRLLGNVFVVETPGDIPGAPHPQAIYVTCDGFLAGGQGAVELWAEDSERQNPLSRRNLLRELAGAEAPLNARLGGMDAALAELTEKRRDAASATEQALAKRDDCRRSADLKRGENQILSRELGQAKERLDTVSWELEKLGEQAAHSEKKSALAVEMEHARARRAEIRQLTEKHHLDQQGLEEERSGLQAGVIDANVLMAQHKGNTENYSAQCAPLAERIRQAEKMIADRSERMAQYRREMIDLRRGMEQASAERPGIERDIETNARRLKDLTLQKRAGEDELAGLEERLQTLRHSVEEHLSSKSDMAVRCSEARMRRQNLQDRIVSEYKIPPDAIQSEPAPEWDAEPDPEALDAMIAEARAKIEAIGPVNLVAIEEYRELEDRNAMLTRQNDDLVKSKQMLLDMIHNINQTTSEMFAKSFEKINENFQNVFRRLFGGGSAKLALTDAENMLECGVEIIASPPGKRLTGIQLLSGGERTMTAVALLFAIYMMKPSPFCVLDELDAPLDESNIQRFLDILKGFLQQSQFVIITHNRQTIGTGDVIYGVTMEESKVSRIVSMRFNKEGRPTPAPAPTPAAPGAHTAASG